MNVSKAALSTILLVGYTNDPATRYAWAQSVNKQLAGPVLLPRRVTDTCHTGRTVAS